MIRVFVSLLLAVALAGCAAAPEVRPDCSPVAGEVVFEATDRLNPDSAGAPLSTEVHVYQLRDPSVLETVSFEDMWQRPAEVLGDALVSEETLVVHPGAEVRRQLRAAEDATHLAAVVIVREPAGRTWRALAPIERVQSADEVCAASTQRITFRLDGYRIEAVARLTEEASP